MTVAEQLVQRGHWVTLFDARPVPGGLLIYGIPNFKLPKKIVFDIWDDLLRAGATFVGNIYIGPRITIDKLFTGGYNAIFLGTGHRRRHLAGCAGRKPAGVYKATDFLIRSNVDKDLLPHDMLCCPEIGDNVVVIGGGDTGADCLRTALRLGGEERHLPVPAQRSRDARRA